MSSFIVAVISGLSAGALLFLAASGLTLVFGVMRIINFAQGAMVMLGAFIFHSALFGQFQPTIPAFVLSVVITTIAMALFGVVLDVILIHRLVKLDEVPVLLATFGLLLAITGAIPLLFGTLPLSSSLPESIDRTVTLGSGIVVPLYDLILIVVAAIVTAFLAWLLNSTGFGRRVKAVSDDSDMAEASGVRSGSIRMLAFALGSALAGLGGALFAPLVTLDSGLGAGIVVEVFVVIVVAGLGSIWGALLVCLLLSILVAMFSLYAADLQPYVLYSVMGLAILLKPGGFFGARHSE